MPRTIPEVVLDSVERIVLHINSGLRIKEETFVLALRTGGHGRAMWILCLAAPQSNTELRMKRIDLSHPFTTVKCEGGWGRDVTSDWQNGMLYAEGPGRFPSPVDQISGRLS